MGSIAWCTTGPTARWTLLASLALTAIVASPVARADQGRKALVIGNGAYKKAVLANPRKDAAAVSKQLRGVGFTVELRKDLRRKGLRKAVNRFIKNLSPTDVALFYFAGHGVQLEGRNYLLGVDFDADTEADAVEDAYALRSLLKQLDGRTGGLNIVILDACRDDPYTRSWSRSASSRGLAVVQRAPTDSYIAFATQPGLTASDGRGQKNSPFTQALVKRMATPGLELNQLFMAVRGDVMDATDNRQSPQSWDNRRHTALFHFVRQRSAPHVPAPVTVAKQAVPRPDTDAQVLAALARAEDLGRGGDVAGQVRELATLARMYPRHRLAPRALFEAAVLTERQGDAEAAFEGYHRVVSYYPANEEVAGDALFILATLLDAKGDHSMAAGRFESMRRYRTHPKTPDALRNAGALYEALGKDKPAIKAYDAFEELFGKTAADAPAVALRAAHAARRLGTKKDALARFRALSKKKRSDPAVAMKAHLALDRPQGALDVFRGLGEAARTPALRTLAAEAHFQLGEEARRRFEAIALVTPDQVERFRKALLSLGRELQTASGLYLAVFEYGVHERTVAAATRIGELYAGFATKLVQTPMPPGLSEEEEEMYRFLLDDKAYPLQEKAIEGLTRATALAKEHSVYGPWIERAWRALVKLAPEGAPLASGGHAIRPPRRGIGARAGETDSAARKRLRAALTRQPQDVRARTELGAVHLRSGRIPLARWVLDTAERWAPDPKPAALHNAQAIALAESGDPRAAVGRLIQAIAADGRYTPARVNLGALYARYGFFAKAIEQLEVALRLNPNDLDSLEALADCRFGASEYAKAADLYQQLARRAPRRATPHRRLGRLYQEFLRDDAKALQSYERYLALERSPPSDPVHKIVEFLRARSAQ